MLQPSQEKTYVRVSFLIKSPACSFIKKEALVQVLSCELRKTSENTFFTENFRATASISSYYVVVG